MTKIKIISILIAVFLFGFGLYLAQAATENSLKGYAWSENIGWVSFNSNNNISATGTVDSGETYPRGATPSNTIDGNLSTEYGSGVPMDSGSNAYNYTLDLTFAAPIQTLTQIRFTHTDSAGYGASETWKLSLYYNNTWNTIIDLSGSRFTSSQITRPNEVNGSWNNVSKLKVEANGGYSSTSRCEVDICAHYSIQEINFSPSYGVSIDSTTGKFSGYAWSENIGWIQFNPSGPYPSSPNYSVKLDFGTGQVSGWAKAIAADGNGWDGWIKMSGSNYQVTRNNSTGEFEGWAWGSEVVGWLSFNCKNQGVCGASNYKVVVSILNRSPSASNLTVSSPSQSTYCPPSTALHSFSWTYTDPDGNNEAKFDFQADNNSDFSSPEVNRAITSSTASGGTDEQRVQVTSGGGTDKLDYNKTYFWRVKVYDSGSPQLNSGWISGSQFSTAVHQYPNVAFSWSPTRPSVNENVKFKDNSTTVTTPQIKTRNWTFQDGNPSSSTQENPQVKFLTQGTKNVTLQITDNDDFVCSKTEPVQAMIALPSWKEISPNP